MTSVVRRQEQDDSGEYSDGSQENDHQNSGNEASQNESDYGSSGNESESDKDQESQDTQRRVDDDEDRSNPQYIPKRGTFYEHDDRTAPSGEETAETTLSDQNVEKKDPAAEPTPERRRPPRKSEIIDKWTHDKYNENEQMPKSRDELVAIYGYDIRNEDAPPHARRNRRYGRGPNKYTRTWEDEEAYKRQGQPTNTPRKPPNPEDFPELDAANRRPSKRRPQRPRSKSQPAVNEPVVENGTNLHRNPSMKSPKNHTPRIAANKPTQKLNTSVKSNSSQKSQSSTKQPEKMPPIENLSITATLTNNGNQTQRKVNATVAQQRPVPTVQSKKAAPAQPQPQPQPQPQSQPANAPQKMPVQAASPKTQPAPAQPSQPQAQQTGGASEPRGGSKRYSSLRQRPITEPYSPQQQHRYTEYPGGQQQPAQNQHQGSPVPQMHPQQQIIHQQVHRNQPVNQPPHGPSPPHQNINQPQHTQQQVRLGILEQQQMVSHPHHQIHNIPQPHAMGQMPPAQGYAPPAMMPAQFMQGGNNPVYAGAPMYAQPPPAPYPHQIYQHHNYPPLQATQAGGVTYYSPADQEPPSVPRTQRRPTAAIPIVRPSQPERPANSTEKDNIDRIVENMFVRKPWPANTGVDSKDKAPSEPRSNPETASKESSQPNSLTSSSISTDSRPSAERTGPKEQETKPEEPKTEEQTQNTQENAQKTEETPQESISSDA